MPNLITIKAGQAGATLLRLRELEHIKNPDILFIGSSHTFRGIDTRIFSKNNLNTFNLGSNFQTPQNTFYLLKEYVDAVNPKLIIMDVFWKSMEVGNGSESCIDLTCNAPISWNMMKMNLSTTEINVFNFMIQNYTNRLFYPLEKEQQKILPEVSYISGGYVQNPNHIEKTKKYISEIKLSYVKMEKSQFKYLHSIVQLCNEKKIKLLFISTPIPEESIKATKNYYYLTSTFDLFSQSENIEWLNFNDIEHRKKLNLKTLDDFNDATHLSTEGVKKFNLLLIEELKSKKIIP